MIFRKQLYQGLATGQKNVYRLTGKKNVISDILEHPAFQKYSIVGHFSLSLSLSLSFSLLCALSKTLVLPKLWGRKLVGEGANTFF